MAGLKIVLPLQFTNVSLPVLRADPIMPTNGALALIEPMHPAAIWPSGVPENGAVLPNIAKETATQLLGANVDASFRRHDRFTGALGTMNRSPKGGLHGVPATSGGLANVGAAIDLPAALRTYLFEHPENDFYASLWSRVTRPSTTNTDFATELAATGFGQLLNFTHTPTGAASYPASTNATSLGANNTSARPADGTSRHSAAVTKWTVNPGNVDAIKTLAANWAQGTNSNWSNLDKHSAWVFYRYYVEDLTVSKRSFAEVDALDNALFKKEVLTSGGRYYGDS